MGVKVMDNREQGSTKSVYKILGIASLVSGCISLFIPVLVIPGLTCGIIALCKNKKDILALLGVIFSAIVTVITVIYIVIVVSTTKSTIDQINNNTIQLQQETDDFEKKMEELRDFRPNDYNYGNGANLGDLTGGSSIQN